MPKNKILKKTKKKKQIVLQERDINILLFIYLWKISNTQSIAKKFFIHSTGPFTTFNRLNALKKAGFITSSINRAPHTNFWELTNLGYSVVKNSHLGENLKMDCFLSDSIVHDSWVKMVLLGPWIQKLPSELHICTDQMLKCFEKEMLPTWVPEYFTHRPDGYWAVEKGSSLDVIALEVELHSKSKSRYRALFSSYEAEDKITKVIFVVKKESDALKLERICEEESPSNSSNKYFYFLANDIEKNGWAANSIRGPTPNFSLANLVFNTSSVKHQFKASDPSVRTLGQAYLSTNVRTVNLTS